MFPPSVIARLHALLSACVQGLMLPLGDRVRPPPNAPPRERLPERLVVRIQQWLILRRSRIAVLMENIAAGRHRPRRAATRAVRPDAAPKPRRAIPPGHFLPREFGWIAQLAPEVAVHADGLSRLLAEPEMQAMVLASPQLARLWGPLLNAAGQRKPHWWPTSPPRPRRSRAARPQSAECASSVVAGPDPAGAVRQADPPRLPQAGVWIAPPRPLPPPRRVANWREFLDSVRPVSTQNFEPPPSEWVVVRPNSGKPDF